MKCHEIPFGTLPTGKSVFLYHLENSSGIQAEVISYGGIIHRLVVPDRSGNMADIVMGQDTLESYVKYPMCSAAVIGRCANRVAGATFTINDKTYFLERTMGDVTLHSGSGNYANKLFTGRLYENGTEAGVELYYKDDGRGGFPGSMDVWITYALNEDGVFEIRYRALPEMDTVINLTNHAYFNLAGHASGPVGSQLLKLEADFYLPNDISGVPTGEVLKVEGTDMDFTSLTPFERGFASSDPQLSRYGGYDHNFCLRGRGFRKVAEARDPASGRGMEVLTDLPGLQLYTANFMRGDTPCKDGAKYQKRGAFCLETQHFPNAVNQSQFPSPIYLAKQEFNSKTAFRFFTF